MIKTFIILLAFIFLLVFVYTAMAEKEGKELTLKKKDYRLEKKDYHAQIVMVLLLVALAFVLG